MEVRHKKRLAKILESMNVKQSVVVNHFCKDKASREATYSFLSHKGVKIEDLQSHFEHKCCEQVESKHYLCIQDTCTYNFDCKNPHIDLNDDYIGPTDNQYGVGFRSHPVLTIDIEKNFPIGFPHIKIWSRRSDSPDKHERSYQQLPIEEKESYRWIEASVQSKAVMIAAKTLTFVGDRENDIYEDFVLVPDERCHLLIRSKSNRCLYGEDEKLYTYLSNQPVAKRYQLEVPRGKDSSARTSEVELRFSKVKLARPNDKDKSVYPPYVEMYAIEVKECDGFSPKGKSPICWRLLTTHTIETVEQALECVEWYKMRWHIEQLFRTTKRKGLNVQASQLSSGFSLQKLTLLTLYTAMQVYQLTLGRDADKSMKATLVFSEEEIKFLYVCCKQELEGRTKKQKNPYPRGSLAWSAWSIARLGGWKGYTDGKAGIVSMTRGLRAFSSKYDGWKLARRTG